jgi:hypothetical protein
VTVTAQHVILITQKLACISVVYIRDLELNEGLVGLVEACWGAGVLFPAGALYPRIRKFL